jgi:Cupin-like domain
MQPQVHSDADHSDKAVVVVVPCRNMEEGITTTRCCSVLTHLPDPSTFYTSHVHTRQPVHMIHQCTQILNNPKILQLDCFVSILQQILVGQSSSRSRYDDDDDDDDDSQRIMEVNVRAATNTAATTTSVTTTTTTSTKEKSPTIGQSSMGTASISSSSSFPSQPTCEEAATVETASTETGTEYAFSPIYGSYTIQMPFKDVYQKIFIDHNDQFYVTTPALSIDEEGRPANMTWLTQQILKYHPHFIPIRPKLLGHLIPMNIGNIWIGCTSTSSSSSATGTSSGLHHDYHDNLYCLIQGTKVIRLAPPHSIHHMTMVGTFHTLHSNGRIVYQEQIQADHGKDAMCPIRPDGALVVVEQIVQLEISKEAIESELLQYRNSDQSQDKAKIQNLENELNDIEEQILDIEMSRGGTTNCFDADADHISSDDDDDDDDDESVEGIYFGTTLNPNIKNKTDPILPNDFATEPNAKRVKRTTSSSNKQNGTFPQEKAVPPNFVRQYDRNRVTFQTITMNAGDALYIPAGWFHEVVSIGSNQPKDGGDSTMTAPTTKSCGDDHHHNGIHMAINYWYHPPDAITGQTNFHQPYVSQFWQRDWDAREHGYDVK